MVIILLNIIIDIIIPIPSGKRYFKLSFLLCLKLFIYSTDLSYTPSVMASTDPDTPGIILPIPIMNPFSRFNISVFLYILLYLAYRNNDFWHSPKTISTCIEINKPLMLIRNMIILFPRTA